VRTDAFLGNIMLCALLTPALVWLVLRRWGGLAGLTARHWLALYTLGSFFCLAVLPRKHLESAIILRWPTSFLAHNLAQVDNELWEQVGKLLAMLVALWLFGSVLRPLFMHKRSALALGYWTGLAYGIGEALILAILFAVPSWAPVFGLRTFTPYTVGWGYVIERLFAVHFHAIMGALIGLGLHGLLALGSRRRLIAFFVLAMAYHHLGDGIIITAGFSQTVAQLVMALNVLFVPVLLVVGFAILALVYRRVPAPQTSTHDTVT